MQHQKIYTATMKLPKNGKQIWTDIMQANVKISADISENQPIVMATAKFKNGIMVVGGVLKSAVPEEFNIKFFYAFDINGNLIASPYQPIDVSDHQDFMSREIHFILNDNEAEEYILKIIEKQD